MTFAALSYRIVAGSAPVFGVKEEVAMAGTRLKEFEFRYTMLLMVKLKNYIFANLFYRSPDLKAVKNPRFVFRFNCAKLPSATRSIKNFIKTTREK